MDNVQDLIDGLERCDDDLEGEIALPKFGNNVLLTIAIGDVGTVSQAQRKSLSSFHESIQEHYPNIERAIFQYYQTVMPTFREALGKYADELMPVLASQSQIWDQVTDPGIFIFPDEEGGELHLEYECSFDVEHGLRVVFQNNHIIRVGLE